MSSRRVCHISTVHVPFDQRIFHRECWSLARAGYEVHLLVQLDDTERVVDGVHVHSIGPTAHQALGLRLQERIKRMFRAERLARKLDARVYHLHDPELIPLGVWLKCTTSAVVIFDCHENNTGYIRQKHYLHPLLRNVLVAAMGAMEKLAARFLDAVVSADRGVAQLYRRAFRARHVAVVHNFPRLDLFGPTHATEDDRVESAAFGAVVAERRAAEVREAELVHATRSGPGGTAVASANVDSATATDWGDDAGVHASRDAGRNVPGARLDDDWDSRPFDLVYHGTIPRYHLEVSFEVAEELRRRGINARWLFFGKCPEAAWAATELEKRGLQDQFVIDASFIPHEKVAARVRQARIGFIPLPDLPKFQHNIPTKLFEFMGLGMPTVLSDLPPSRQFVGDGRCAVMVRADDYAGYAAAIARLLQNPDDARRMGIEGMRRTREHLNWESESAVLVRLYQSFVEV